MKLTFTLIILTSIMTMAQLKPVQVGSYHMADADFQQGTDKETLHILEGTSPHLSYLEIHRTTMYPGAKPSTAHANADKEECIFVMQGTMEITIEGKRTILGPESVILLMPQQMHSMRNIGDTKLSYYVMKYESKKAMDIARGQSAGGSLMLNSDSLVYKKSAVGGGRAYFDRPTAMCERFELHVTKLANIGQSHAPHDHPESEIMLVISGETEMKIDGKNYTGKSGDLYFIPSGLFHGVSNANDAPCSYFLFRWK